MMAIVNIVHRISVPSQTWCCPLLNVIVIDSCGSLVIITSAQVVRSTNSPIQNYSYQDDFIPYFTRKNGYKLWVQ